MKSPTLGSVESVGNADGIGVAVGEDVAVGEGIIVGVGVEVTVAVGVKLAVAVATGTHCGRPSPLSSSPSRQRGEPGRNATSIKASVTLQAISEAATITQYSIFMGIEGQVFMISFPAAVDRQAWSELSSETATVSDLAIEDAACAAS